MLRGWQLPTSSEIVSTLEYRPSCQNNTHIRKSSFFGSGTRTTIAHIAQQKDFVFCSTDQQCIARLRVPALSSKKGSGRASLVRDVRDFSNWAKPESDSAGSSRSKVSSGFDSPSSCLQERLPLNRQEFCGGSLGYSSSPSSSCDSRSELQGADSRESSSLSNLWKRICWKRRTRSLVILNFLAALYGSSTVAGKFAAEAAPELPESLSSMVSSCSALVLFLPELTKVIRTFDAPALKAGMELGALSFVATILETLGNNGGVSSDAPLLFAFTMIFVPIMELCAGRQSMRKATRLASLVALSGMGLLEEEGVGWKGIPVPQIENLWGLVASAILGLHIFRSESHSKSVDPVSVTAVQCGTLAVLSVLWEACRLSSTSYDCMQYLTQLESLPWIPLVYSGLVCAGLCNWLELRGLRSVSGSTTTMINTTIPLWGAFFSFLLRGDVPGESAVLGGSVILCASFFAQMATKQVDSVLNAPKLKISKQQTFNQNGDLTTSKAAASDQSLATSTANDVFTPAADDVQEAIINSQLKSPYYATQVKKLMTELKLTVVSAKSAVAASLKVFAGTAGSVTTSSLMSSSNGPAEMSSNATAAAAAASAAVHASTTASTASAITSAAATTVHQAVNNIGATSGTSPTIQATPLLQGTISSLPELINTHTPTTYLQSATQWVDQADHFLQRIAEDSISTASTAVNTVLFQGLQATANELTSQLHQIDHLALLATQTRLDNLIMNSSFLHLGIFPWLAHHSHLIQMIQLH